MKIVVFWWTRWGSAQFALHRVPRQRFWVSLWRLEYRSKQLALRGPNQTCLLKIEIRSPKGDLISMVDTLGLEPRTSCV